MTGCSAGGAAGPPAADEAGGASFGTGGAATGGGPAFAATGGAGAATGSGGFGAAPPVPVGVPDAGNLPFGGYDPTVTFEWPEASGAGAGSCKAGHYQGSFAGIYSPSIAVAPVPIPVAGNIDLTLTKSENGEFFDITGGKVSGVADLLFPFSADVSGTLNCTTAQLENGFLSNGTYIVGVIPYPFEGPLTGNYDKLTHAFTNDAWTVGEPKWSTPPPLFGGNGTWQATWVGP